MSNPGREIEYKSRNGYGMVAAGIILLLCNPVAPIVTEGQPWAILLALVLALSGISCLAGIYMLQPNQAAVMTLFGAYRGSDKSSGLRWANPFLIKKKVSLRANNFVSEKIKVNDKRGNPIEIAAAIVWRVADTALATFGVENYEQFVRVQSETALRHLASCYAYDDMDEPHDEREITLRSGGPAVTAALLKELTSALEIAGLSVDEARLTHLAYAPEIAGAMLRRQQAEAILAARRKIVQGAVGMVESALHALTEKGLMNLDDERRAAMVSNLLVVLVGERDVTPVINSGTLYN